MEKNSYKSNTPSVINHLLLIDDDPLTEVLLEGISGNLHLINRYVFKAGGKQALDYLTFCERINDFPDLIILDLMMPEMDGFEFLQLFEQKFQKEISKCAVVIASNSHSEQDKTAKEKFSSVKMFIQKPIVKEKFIEIYNSVLG